MCRSLCHAVPAFVFLCIFGARPSPADRITFSETLDRHRTNWTRNAALPKFDPALGMLDSVTIEVTAFFDRTLRYESLDDSPATVILRMDAEVVLTPVEQGNPVVLPLPRVQVYEDVEAFDETIDFDGSSGGTVLTETFVQSEAASFGPPLTLGEFDLFTGAGQFLTVPVRAAGSATANGPGNVIYSFESFAAAEVTIDYQFTAVPEPTTAGLMIFGAPALPALRPRRTPRRRG